MDFDYTPENLAFRERVETWFADNVPGDWGSEAWPKSEDPDEFHQDLVDWQRKIYDAGWAGITWPKQYGGLGATPIDYFIFQEAASNYTLPYSVATIGTGMGGPTIMSWGTDAQKDRYLDNILSGEEIWCQGFSEPNSGSDLASLATRAEDAGDHFVVSGQKIWTSVAHRADWCMLLTRTGTPQDRHRGLTYLLVDMHSPGVTVKPLVQITGDAEFNEIFFEDVKVPKENILGEVGQGWAVAITTLMHERVNIAAELYSVLKRTYGGLVELARKTRRGGRPLIEDPAVRRELARFWGEVETQRLNNLRMRANLKGTDDPGPIGSIFKLLWADTNKRVSEFALSLAGPYGQLHKDSALAPGGGDLIYSYMRNRANSIEGGTTEILLGIIGDRVLNLPRK